MPMSGSNYVAPTWVDKGPPALDATELQAMCNTIQENQGDAAALQAALRALTTTVRGKAKVEVKTYVGTDTSGSANPTTVTFSFSPSLVVINAWANYSHYETISIVRGAGNTEGIEGGNLSFLKVAWSWNSISWYASNAARQGNLSGFTNYVIGIG